MVDFYGRKRKFRLKLILTMKKSDFNVNEFLLIENVYLRCFFSLKLALNNKFELKKSCSFQVHYESGANFWVVGSYVFYEVLRLVNQNRSLSCVYLRCSISLNSELPIWIRTESFVSAFLGLTLPIFSCHRRYKPAFFQ